MPPSAIMSCTFERRTHNYHLDQRWPSARQPIEHPTCCHSMALGHSNRRGEGLCRPAARSVAPRVAPLLASGVGGAGRRAPGCRPNSHRSIHRGEGSCRSAAPTERLWSAGCDRAQCVRQRKAVAGLGTHLMNGVALVSVISARQSRHAPATKLRAITATKRVARVFAVMLSLGRFGAHARVCKTRPNKHHLHLVRISSINAWHTGY